MAPAPSSAGEAAGLAAIDTAASAASLTVLGAFHPLAGDAAPDGTGTLVLLGPRQPGFWARVSAEPEFADGAPDPLDRWSARVAGDLARRLGARALHPFGGPPYLPFIAWAKRTGRMHGSPVGLMVHDRFGLFVSIRAALALPARLEVPPPPAPPCAGCPAPCRDACPAGALTPGGYDVPACRAWLEGGGACRDLGCAVRRACPVGRDLAPPPAQAAFHMAAFRGRSRT